MSEPRVSEQDALALVKRYGDARAGKALHNGPAQQASCDAALSAVQDALAAARQAAEQRADVATLTAACAAHRVCCGEEHNPSLGKLHGYCVVCGIPWPCTVAESFGAKAAEREAAARGEQSK